MCSTMFMAIARTMHTHVAQLRDQGATHGIFGAHGYAHHAGVLSRPRSLAPDTTSDKGMPCVDTSSTINV